MIKETNKKINFHPYVIKKGRIKNTDAAPVVAISKKYGRLNFSKAAVRELNMSNRFVRLYYEPHRKIVGWRIKDKLNEDTELKAWKFCSPSKSGVWGMSITKMLTEFGTLKQDSYKNLSIQKYRELSTLDQHNGEVFFFVEIN